MTTETKLRALEKVMQARTNVMDKWADAACGTFQTLADRFTCLEQVEDVEGFYMIWHTPKRGNVHPDLVKGPYPLDKIKYRTNRQLEKTAKEIEHWQ